MSRTLSLLLLLSLGACRLYFTAAEVAPGEPVRAEAPDTAPVLLDFYIDPTSLAALDEGSYVLRLVHLDERGREDHAESIAVRPGFRLLLMRPGTWALLEICRVPCKSYAVRQKRGYRLRVEDGAVNYLGSVIAELGEGAAFEVRTFPELAEEALAESWPGLAMPLRGALEPPR